MNYRNIELLNDISPATCDWILRNPLYQEWKSANSGVLWIKGNPGTGKSTLLAFVFQEFAKGIKTDANQLDQLVLSFFFHARGTTLQKTRVGMFRTLLFQLLKAVPQTCTPLLEDFVERQDSVQAGERVDWHENELGTFLLEILSTPGFPRRVVVFVDALDEAGKQVANELIEYFYKVLETATSQSVKLKICFSSRPYPILLGISSVSNIVVENQNNEGIVQYIQNFLQKLSPDDTVKKHDAVEEFEELIVTNAKGVFQWARLVLETLAEADREREPLERLRSLLQKIPQDLYKMYHHLLTEILDENHRKETILLFQWVCFAHRPMSIYELREAMAFDDEYFSIEGGSNFSYSNADYEDFEVRIKVWSAGLVEVKRRLETTTVQIIHQTVGDFLREEGGGLQTLLPSFRSMPALMGESHTRLTRVCLNCLRHTSLAFIRWATVEYSHRQGQTGVLALPGFLIYVRDCWYIHVREAENRGRVQLDLVDRLGFPGRKNYYFGLMSSLREGKVFRFWLVFYFDSAIHHPLGIYTNLAFEGTTLVHLAASQNLHGIMDELQRRRINIAERDSTGQTALHYAARGGHISMVKRLLKKSLRSSIDVDVEAKDLGATSAPKLTSATSSVNGVTALMIAVWNGHIEIIKLLLQKKAKINVYNTVEYGYLSKHSASRGIDKTAELLLADRKEFQDRNLIPVILDNDIYAVEVMIKQGALVNVMDRRRGASPLHCAALLGNLEIVNLLVDAGAELDVPCPVALGTPTEQEYWSETLQAILPRLSKPSGWDRQDLYRMVQAIVIVFGNAQRDVPTITGLTPLRIAAERGHTRIVKRLLAAGANPNFVVTRPGATAIEAAAGKGHLEVVNRLLAAGANPNTPVTRRGVTALEAAASNGHSHIVEELVLHGAEVYDEPGEACHWAHILDSLPVGSPARKMFPGTIESRAFARIYPTHRPVRLAKREPRRKFAEIIEVHHRRSIREVETRLQTIEFSARKESGNEKPIKR